jgi:hypothetical protein
MKILSLLHATRGTPERALATRKTWLDRADDADHVEHIFGIQSDDMESIKAFTTTEEEVYWSCTTPPPAWASSSVANWNICAEFSTGHILVAIADDLTPPQGWDTKLRKLPDPETKWACYVPDSLRQDGLMCHPVLSRALYDKRGYVFHPDFFGVYCDNDFSVRTQLEAPIYSVRDLEWQHNHPTNGSRESDSIVEHQNSETAYAYGGAKFMQKWPLNNIFQRSRGICGDINEHMLRLAQLARQCEHVTEFGVRTGMSTYSFLHGLSDKPRAILRSYDLHDFFNVYAIRNQLEIDWTFRQGSTLEADVIEPTDLLFIDTLHTYAQVKGELERHGNQARKYIAFHDTVAFGVLGEDNGTGINLAIQEWMRDNDHWVLFEHYENNNGLTILTRK